MLERCWPDFVQSTVDGKFYECPTNVQEYVEGKIPNRKEQLQWMKDVKQVYTPMCWDGLHWDGLNIDIVSSQIHILDSNSKTIKHSFVKKNMDLIAHMLPYLLHFMKVGNEIGLMFFGYKRVRKVSCGAESVNSGPLACKHIEMHANGKSKLNEIDWLGIEDIKMEYSIDVYETFIKKIF